MRHDERILREGVGKRCDGEEVRWGEEDGEEVGWEEVRWGSTYLLAHAHIIPPPQTIIPGNILTHI